MKPATHVPRPSKPRVGGSNPPRRTTTRTAVCQLCGPFRYSCEIHRKLAPRLPPVEGCPGCDVLGFRCSVCRRSS